MRYTFYVILNNNNNERRFKMKQISINSQDTVLLGGSTAGPSNIGVGVEINNGDYNVDIYGNPIGTSGIQVSGPCC